MSNIPPAASVANPKLTLYAFHLRNNLAVGSDEPADNADLLWEQCQILGQKLGVPRLQSLIERLKQEGGGTIGVPPGKDNQQSDYRELLPLNENGKRSLDFSAIPDGSSRQLRGEIYPLQIHDTYAVDITLRYPYPNIEIAHLSGLNYEGCLLPDKIKASLGQSLIFFAQPLGEIENYKTFADECVKALLPEPDAENLLKFTPVRGQFLGSPIFEYDNGQDNPANHLHLLIWLNCDAQTEALEAEGSYYQPLINLLCCRSKILYAYSEARWCNNQARIAYKELEAKVQAFKNLPSDSAEKLVLLKKWLTEMPMTAFEYARHLRDLEIHRTTLETNAKNYRFWLKQLRRISLKDADNLDFLQEFFKYAEETLTEQIRVDLAYLTPAQKLFEETIATIRGIVEIEQAESDRRWQDSEKERDRNLQTWITVVGAGIGVAGVTAAASPYLMEAKPKDVKINWRPFSSSELHPFTYSIILSLGIGAAGAGIALLLIYLGNWLKKQLMKLGRGTKSSRQPRSLKNAPGK